MNKLTKQRAPFTQVPNALLSDNTISFKAKGLYALMYSKPDGWTFYESALSKESRDGKDAVGSGLDELVRAGWLLRSGGRADDTGRFTAYDYELVVNRGFIVHQSGKAVAENPLRETRDGKPATNKTEENKKEKDSPQPPRGPCGWEEDSGFMKISAAYAKLNPSRVDNRKAWTVWQERGLSSSAEPILAAIPYFAGLEQWTREAGRFIPSLSKWLEDGAWRNAGKVSVQVSAEVLAEREKTSKAGMAAFARIESDKRLNLTSSEADLEAVSRWNKMRMGA